MSVKGRRSLTQRERISYVILITSFSIIYFGIFLPLFFANIPLGQEIKKIPFTENGWFEATDVRIINNFRPDFIVVNDELKYEITYENKQEDEITISSVLEVIYGGQIVNSYDSKQITLQPSEKRTQQFIFHLANAGGNQVRLTATILNSTNAAVLDGISTTINTGAFSQPEALQYVANRNTSYGIMISLGVGVVTSLILIATLRSTRKQASATLQQAESISTQNRLLKEQLDITKDEMSKTLRPWIGRVDLVFEGVIWDDGAFNTEKEFSSEAQTRKITGTPARTTHHRFIFWIQNYGRLPATNCVSSYTTLTYKGPPEKYKDPEPSELDKLNSYEPITIMPNEKVPLRFDIPINDITQSVVICRIKYDYPSGTGLYEFMVRYDGSNWIPIYNNIK